MCARAGRPTDPLLSRPRLFHALPHPPHPQVSAESLCGISTKKAAPSTAAPVGGASVAAGEAAAADSPPTVQPKTADALSAIHASMDNCFLFAGE